MKKILVLFVVVISPLLLVLCINIALTQSKIELIPTSMDDNAWLAFWGSYVGGIATLIAVYVTIRQNEKNNSMLIKQQNMLIERQNAERKTEEYNQCLKNNLELLNVLDASSALVVLNYNDDTDSKKSIVNMKSKIFTYDLQLRYAANVELGEYNFESEKAYFEIWNENRSLLSDILDAQLHYIERISRHRIDSKLKSNYISQIISSKEHMAKAHRLGECDMLQEIRDDISSYKDSLDQVEKSIETYESEIDKISELIKTSVDTLLPKIKSQFDLSVKLVGEMNDMVEQKYNNYKHNG